MPEKGVDGAQCREGLESEVSGEGGGEDVVGGVVEGGDGYALDVR